MKTISYKEIFEKIRINFLFNHPPDFITFEKEHKTISNKPHG